VFAGERTREGNDLYREMIESGVIKLGDKQVIIPFIHIIFVALHQSDCFWRIEARNISGGKKN
jgi:hypothetical protein